MITGGVKIRRYNNLCFYVTDTKVIVSTPLQTFKLVGIDQYSQAYVRLCKGSIIDREIQSIDDLIRYGEHKVTLIRYQMDWLDDNTIRTRIKSEVKA